MTQIAFIGGGNMATSIIGGLLKQGDTHPDLIHVSDPSSEQRDRLSTDFGVQCHADNLDAIVKADVIIVAVKPQMMKAVIEPLRDTLSQQQPLIISIAAGINMASLSRWSGCNAIVRCMPNTPSLLALGATGLFASERVSLDQRNIADAMMRAVGITVWVQTEAEIDIVTALSGSGPAYYFLLMESMIKAAQTMGLSEKTATQLTLQTALGAGQMAAEADVNPAELRRRVTSPGGTTERAIAQFEQANFAAIVQTAMNAAQDRAAELSHQLAD